MSAETWEAGVTFALIGGPLDGDVFAFVPGLVEPLTMSADQKSVHWDGSYMQRVPGRPELHWVPEVQHAR